MEDRRHLSGNSLVYYEQRQIDSENNLLGDRFLTRKGSFLLVAPSGVGKSALVVQMTACFPAGLPCCHIEPSGELRILYVEAEDYDDDLTEMAQVIKHLKLTPEQIAKVGNNTRVEIVNDVVGEALIRVLDDFLSEWSADIVIINPYQSYLGESMTDDKQNTLFLRHWLNPLLDHHNCAAIIAQHTPKLDIDDIIDKSDISLRYIGAGVAGLTNWARAILVLFPTDDPDVFTLGAVKRGKKIGWGKGVTRRTICHSQVEGQILWVPPTLGQSLSTTPKGKFDEGTLLAHIESRTPQTRFELHERVNAKRGKKEKVSQKRVDGYLDILVRQEKAYVWKLRRNGVKSGIGYARKEQSFTGN